MNNSLKNIIIRKENAADYKEIDNITRKAFDKSGELVAELVNNIRNSPNYIPVLSLVADKNGEIVGHIMLSHLNLDDNGTLYKIITLSPLSVEPMFQKKGIGSSLIKTVIKKADELEEPLIMLEGNPSYYSRFGFKPGKEFGISIALPHWAPEAAMILPLSKYNQAIKGKIIYPPYFDKVNTPT
ncbi:MAG TPA: N-acetyltransferase, partial [Patescibacteria group bacterium]